MKRLSSLSDHIIAAVLMTAVTIFAMPFRSAVSESTTVEKYTFKGSAARGLGSGLAFVKSDESGIFFYTITDRGPNGKVSNGNISLEQSNKGEESYIFPEPNFNPVFALIRLHGGKLSVIERKPFLDAQSDKPYLGRVGSGKFGLGRELSMSGVELTATEAAGLDPEAVAWDQNGVLWIAEETRPSILKVDAKSGRVLKRITPGDGLPEILGERRSNRGFESITIDGQGRVVAALQSPLKRKYKLSEPFVRLVRYEPSSGRTELFALPVASAENVDVKIGDATWLSDQRFLFIEAETEKKPGLGGNKGERKRLIIADLAGATDIQQDRDGSYIQARRHEFLDLGALGWKFAKAEGLAVSLDRRMVAITNDNDFGIKDIEITTPAGKTPTSARIIPNNEPSQLWIIKFAAPINIVNGITDQ